MNVWLIKTKEIEWKYDDNSRSDKMEIGRYQRKYLVIALNKAQAINRMTEYFEQIGFLTCTCITAHKVDFGIGCVAQLTKRMIG